MIAALFASAPSMFLAKLTAVTGIVVVAFFSTGSILGRLAVASVQCARQESAI